MRALCTVSAPLEVCAPPTRPLSPGSRFLTLKLLGIPQNQPRTLYFLVEAKSRVKEVYSQTCLHFAKQGMEDTELFGLAVLIDGEYLFADPDSKLSKYGPKSWRSSHTHGLDANGRPLLELHFRVQFYLESPLMLRDDITRHNYYLQLKSNIVSRELPKECSEQLLLVLGGLALQADYGDITEDQGNVTDYFRIEDYIPNNFRSSWGITALQSCHRNYRGMSRAEAENLYIREACNQNEMINAHYFRMKSNKNETGCGSVSLIVYARGIKIVAENMQSSIFQWPSIVKLSFDRKKFEIRSFEDKKILYASNDDKNKMILSLCRDTHQFSMSSATRLSEAIKREEEEISLHPCYMYSRSLHLTYKNKNDQRISVISSTSSNTTSGIVSDRVHSEDELEIMINSPPAVPIAAPSTESLALAHLLDRPSVSRQTSSVGQVSLKDLEETFAVLSVRSNIRSSNSDTTAEPLEQNPTTIQTESPNSQHNVGSQSSSTCSTVVVATEIAPQTTLGSHTTIIRRRPSTSSSLELGFSHTAQNSAISESTSNCIDPIYGSTTGEEESTSGVYTLAHPAPTETSGIYTMTNSSELTGESSEMAESEDHESSHYGSFVPKSEIGRADVNDDPIDSVDGDFRHRINSHTDEFRLRSDSNISASGSFRGDGSDPTDNKHTLLSANELTDLIVGRGTYPNRKTVSNTIDSDCDYVTLPLPLEGDSYIQGHEDTAPTDESYEHELMRPPTPPVRVDSTSRSILTNIVDIHTRLPPPYNSRHETTGLSGPPIRSESEVRPLVDPPPYPQQPIPVTYPQQPSPPRPMPIIPVAATPQPTCVSKPLPEEANARFITTRPQINILKAHTTVVSENAKPSYAAPTVPTVTQSQLAISNTIGIPIVPYNIHPSHKNVSGMTPPPPPYPEVKTTPRTCVIVPVIKPRQYVPPPPPTLPRQPPPPPPPPQLATVYTGQLARSQIELYQQQLYSDVDYVIYPIQDPAVSQQEYLDAKQGSLLAAMAQSPPPPPYLFHTGSHSNGGWDTCKGHAIYRSTPYLSMALPHSRYASTQNLSDTYVQLPAAYSPLYSPSVASVCSSYEPPPPPPFRQRPLTATNTMFARSRSRSDDNILNSVEATPRPKRLPPPPPKRYETNRPCKPPIPTPTEIKPPLVPFKSLSLNAFGQQIASTTTTPASDKQQSAPISSTKSNNSPNNSVDIMTIREKSKLLDLPLISQLCNDRSLMKQTKAFVMPKHPRSLLTNTTTTTAAVTGTNIPCTTLTQGNLTKTKYPVSGLNNTELAKPRKLSISHRHPSDKLPPLPCQTATANNYVMDPTPTPIKHKSFNSQPTA